LRRIIVQNAGGQRAFWFRGLRSLNRSVGHAKSMAS
jgi:hypothetical protein